MRIWIDADACPGPIKEILFRTAQRRRVETVVVANHAVQVPRSPYIRSIQVESGFDVADARIVSSLAAGDLVITADVPLAADVVARNAVALNPRGTLYTERNVQDHLSRRDLMHELRSMGAVSGGPAALGKAEIQTFANELDKYVTRHIAKSVSPQ